MYKILKFCFEEFSRVKAVHLGKGFLNKDDFIRAFERTNVKLKTETIDSAFKYVSFFSGIFCSSMFLF